MSLPQNDNDICCQNKNKKTSQKKTRICGSWVQILVPTRDYFLSCWRVLVQSSSCGIWRLQKCQLYNVCMWWKYPEFKKELKIKPNSKLLCSFNCGSVILTFSPFNDPAICQLLKKLSTIMIGPQIIPIKGQNYIFQHTPELIWFGNTGSTSLVFSAKDQSFAFPCLLVWFISWFKVCSVRFKNLEMYSRDPF